MLICNSTFGMFKQIYLSPYKIKYILTGIRFMYYASQQKVRKENSTIDKGKEMYR